MNSVTMCALRSTSPSFEEGWTEDEIHLEPVQIVLRDRLLDERKPLRAYIRVNPIERIPPSGLMHHSGCRILNVELSAVSV